MRKETREVFVGNDGEDYINEELAKAADIQHSNKVILEGLNLNWRDTGPLDVCLGLALAAYAIVPIETLNPN